MSADWRHLADHVRHRRIELGLTQHELAEQAGIGYSTIQLLERGTARTRLPDTIPAVERALGWPPGSARAVLAGQTPESPPAPSGHSGRWRTGRKVGRTIYLQVGPEPSDGDVLIGVMDTPELAAEAVAGHNVVPTPADCPRHPDAQGPD